MKDLEAKNKFVDLRAKGKSFESIAKEIGVSKQTLISWSKLLKTDIENFKQIELDSLRDKYFLQSQQRLEAFGGLLGRLRSEIENRNFKDIPTAKLLELYMRLEQCGSPILQTLSLRGKSDITDILSNADLKWTV